MPFKRTYTDDQFIQAVKDSKYMGEVLFRLGLTEGSRKSAKKLLNQINPDISHWIDFDTLKQNNFKNDLVEIPIDEVLVENSKYIYSDLKKKLLKNNLIKNMCYECGLIDIWNNKPIVLQIDHINGIHNDNRLSNLRLLCPNCHSQTETFCGKMSKIKLPKCKYCDNHVRDRRSKTCKACYLNQDYRIINWPTDQDLIKLLNNNTFSQVAQQLNINESSIRRRIKKKNLTIYISKCKNKS